MIPYNFSDDEDWDKNYDLSNRLNLILHVLDTNTNSIVTDTSLNGIDIDDDGNYYVDIFFDDTLSYMNKFDGDYIIFIGSNLTSTKTYDIINCPQAFTTLFQSVDYWRYVYYSDIGAGILRQVNDDGSLKEGEEAIPTSDELAEQLAQQEAERKEQEKEQARLDAINGATNAINDMSNFMQDDNFSSDSITNNMPNSNEFNDITENGFDNIFNTLRNTFTSSNYQDVVFVVPFSNGQTITLPSDLTEKIVPTAIASLIQMVYWYLIARFIVKDIARYIEKAKSGDIFNSSDTNIKTDML